MATTFSSFDAPSPQNAPQETKSSSPEIVPEVAASPSDPGMLRKLYALMLRCRMVEQRAGQSAHLQRAPLPVCTRYDFEAAISGSLIELRAGDAISSDLGVAPKIVAGQPLGLLFAEMSGLRSEYLAFAPQAADTPVHILPQASTVASQLAVAAGFALALKKVQRPNVVLLHLRDGFEGLGFWHEAATLAEKARLPVIIVAINSCETADASGKSDLRQRGSSYGIPAITVDGNDVVAMWRVTQESIHRARGGAGPTLIDSQVVASSIDAGAPSVEHDPLSRMQRYLEKRNLWDESWREELAQRFASEIDQAQAFFPRPSGTQ